MPTICCSVNRDFFTIETSIGYLTRDSPLIFKALSWGNVRDCGSPVDRRKPKRGRYFVRRSAAIADGKQIEEAPKSQRSQRSRRTEALPPSLIILLEQHQRDQAQRREKLGLPLAIEDTSVFDRENGEPWNVNELSRRWSRFVRRDGLQAARLHDLRHGFASLSHQAKESLHAISIALGHGSIGITSLTYVHLFDTQKAIVHFVWITSSRR